MFFSYYTYFLDKNTIFAYMKVIIDDKIPFIREAALRLFDEVHFLPGAAITQQDVRDADALIVRTRTKCNESLLHDSRVRCVVTATIGYEHLDTDYLERRGIYWTNCPGCNASSVGQYIRNSLLLLKRAGLFTPDRATIGIVGVGHVGTAVLKAIRPFGCTILLNDPPKAETDPAPYSSLDEIAANCDIITFHTPLTKGGKYPTFHLADEHFFRSLKKQPVIINAARGGTVDEDALLRALDSATVKAAVIDTWENEPHISLPLLRKTFIGTPHIAGYSADGKSNATRMSLEATCRFFGIAPDFSICPPALPSAFRPSGNEEERELQLYNPANDSQALKENPDKFEYLRGNYPLRRESWEAGNI